MLKKKILLIPAIISIIFVTGCSGISDNEPVSKTDFYFDTVINITLYGSQNAKYIDKCFDKCKSYEDLLSRTVSSSEISTINKNVNNYTDVSDDTLEIIKSGLHYSQLSEGKFDITVGALSSLWDFTSDAHTVPAQADIEKAISTIDYNSVIVDNNKVMISKEGAVLDLGGIAKGFIADKLKQYLISQGVKSGIIDLGGNILLIGSRPDGSDYNIGIKKPFNDSGENSAVIRVHNKSIVTSGNYERYFYKDGKLYHHILDTSTGYPVENNLYSVSIISDKSIDGDGYSTICFLLGIDKGMEFIEGTEGIEALFIDSDYNIYYSSGLEKDNNVFQIKNS